MRKALEAARDAEQADEVPVGALIVCDDKLVSCANNQSIQDCDPSAHAEMLVIRQAAQLQHNYRLTDATLYVTLEPCMMCAGAMLHARVKRLVFGAYDLKAGVAGGCFDWLLHEKHLHKMQVRGGVMENECSDLLKSYFAQKRLIRS